MEKRLPPWQMHHDDLFIKTKDKKLKKLQSDLNESLEVVDISEEGIISELLMLKNNKDRTEDQEATLVCLRDSFNLKRDILVTTTEIIGRATQIKLQKWKAQTEARMILSQIGSNLEQCKSDQQQRAQLEDLQYTFESLVQAYIDVYSFVRSAQENESAISILVNDEQVKLELQFRFQCHELQVAPQHISEDIRQASSQSNQSDKLAKLKEVELLSDKIRELYSDQSDGITPPDVGLSPFDLPIAHEAMHKEQSYNDHQSEQLQYSDFINDLSSYKRQEGLPDCFELKLFRLIMLLQIKIQNPPSQMYNSLNLKDLDKEISNELNDLIQAFSKEGGSKYLCKQIEKLATYELQNKRQCEDLCNDLKSIKHQTLLFNFKEFFELINKTLEASKKIKNKDIYLLLGSTGTGKSTTIHYLCGSKMIKDKVNGLPHISATEIKIPELKTFSLSPHSKSETRYINSIELDLKSMGYRKQQVITIVDSPGCEDTESPEVDLSNSSGIIKSVSQSQSVVPIILFSQKNFGARFDKIKANIRYYAQMIKNTRQNIEQFKFFFTHMPEEQDVEDAKKEIAIRLKDCFNCLNEQDKSDESFCDILEALLTAAENDEIYIIRPLDENPLAIWQSLLKSPAPIKIPSNAFQMPLIDQTMRKALDQCDLHKKVIIDALKAGELQLASYKYEEVIQFAHIFESHQNIQVKFENIKNTIINLFRENFNSGKQAIRSWFNSNINDNSREYQLQIHQSLTFAKNIEPFIMTHFSTSGDIPHYNDLFSEIIQQASDIQNSLPQEDLIHDSWLDFIRKSKEIKEIEPLKLKQLQECLTFYLQLLDQNVRQCRETIEFELALFSRSNSFIDRAQTFSEMHLAEEENKSNSEDGSLRMPPSTIIVEKNIIEFIKMLYKLEKKLDLPEIKATVQQHILRLKQDIEKKINGFKEKELQFIHFNDTSQKINDLTLQEVPKQKFSGRRIFFESEQKFEQYIENYVAILDNFLKHLDEESLFELRGYFFKLRREIGQIVQNQMYYYKELVQHYLSESDMQYHIRALYEEMKTLRRVPFIGRNTQNEFQRITDEIGTLVQRKITTVQEILNKIEKQMDKLISNYDLRQLREGLQELKQLSWINEQDNLRSHQISLRIAPQLRGIQIEMIDQIVDQKIQLGYHGNIHKVATQASTLSELNTIADIVGIELQKTCFMNDLEKQVNSSFQKIQAYASELDLKGKTDIIIHKNNIPQIIQMVQYINIFLNFPKYFRFLGIIPASIEIDKLSEIIQEGVNNQRQLIINFILNELEKITHYLNKESKVWHQIKQETDQEKKLFKQMVSKIDDSLSLIISINEYFQNNNLLLEDIEEKMKESKFKLLELHESVYNSMIEFNLQGMLIAKKKLQSYLRELCKLDNYIDNETNSFSTLHETCKKEELAHSSKVKENIYTLLKEHNYRELKQALDNSGTQQVQEASRKIAENLQKIVDEAEKFLSLEQINENESKEINQQMVFLINALHNEIDSYIIQKEYQVNYIKSIITVSDHLITLIQNDYTNIIQEINCLKFSTSKRLIKKANLCYKSSIKFFDNSSLKGEAIENAFLNMKNQIAQINEIEKLFKKKLDGVKNLKILDVEQIEQIKLIELLTDLSKDQNDAEFKLAIPAIKMCIENFYGHKIQVLREAISKGIQEDDKMLNQIRILEYSLRHVPEDIAKDVTNKLNSLNQQIYKRKIDEELSIIQNLNENKINSVVSYLSNQQSSISLESSIILNIYVHHKLDQMRKLLNDNILKAFQFESVIDMYLLHKQELVKHYNDQTKNKLSELVELIRHIFDQNIIYVKSLFTSDDNCLSISDQDCLQQVNVLLSFIGICGIDKPDVQECIFPNCYAQLSTMFISILSSIIETNKRFDEGMKQNQQQMRQISKIILQTSKSTQFLNLLKYRYDSYVQNSESYNTPGNQQQLVKQLEQLCNKNQIFNDYCKQVLELVTEIIQSVKDIKSFTQETQTNQNQKERERYFNKLEVKYQFINSLELCALQLSQYSQFDWPSQRQLIQSEILKKIEEMSFTQPQISKIIKSLDVKDEQELTILGLSYENLKTITEYLPSFKNDASIILADMKQIIKRELEDLHSDANVKDIQLKNVVKIIVCLQRAKTYASIEDYKKQIDESIDQILKTVSSNQIIMVNELINELKMYPDGNQLVQVNSFFQGFETALMNKKIQSQSSESIITQIQSITPIANSIDKESLESFYQVFYKEYKEQVRRNLSVNLDLSTLISCIKSTSTKYQNKIISAAQLGDVPQLVAKIFALWTLMKSDAYFKLKDLVKETDPTTKKQEQEFFLIQPHPVQVIAIFRLLGLGYKDRFAKDALLENSKEILNNKIVNSLVQIKTGEGKSVVLAVIAIVFALWGFDVSCVCYSQHLSQRDYQDFAPMFQLLNLTSLIKYGTINEICEKHINRDGQIRQLVKQKLLKKCSKDIEKETQNRRQVLLIDEVDVFFSKEFYNQPYIPITQIMDEEGDGHEKPISEFFDYIWNNRENKAALQFINLIKSEQFEKCATLFRKEYEPVLIENVKSILGDLKDYQNHEWVLSQGMIGYKNQDSISTNMRYGYKTLFACYHEVSTSKISKDKLQLYQSFNIDSAFFSYAEIPHSFCLTLGVTGTLDSITEQEKIILKDNYKIHYFTFCPSVYGISNLYWDSNPEKIHVENSKEKYHISILENMKQNLNGDKGGLRCCIIFFENQKKLDEFKEWKGFEYFLSRVSVLNEQVNAAEMTSKVNLATFFGRITLATRPFGRGTDFVCRDEQVLQNGGVHVIQTFLSELKSEFIQIRGRTARQGQRGSFVMILLDEELKQFDVYEKQIEENKTNLFQYLEKQALLKQQSIQLDDTKALQDLHTQHEQSLRIQQLLLDNKDPKKEILDYLVQINKGPSLKSLVKTLILMDATGSMSSLLNRTKNSVGTMFERAQTILQRNGLDPNMFLIQLACYRNYSSGPSNILEFSPWESKPLNLRNFMNGISSSGGQGNEAIEIGLWHANQEAEKGFNDIPLAQIFLIGDMPPNTKKEVESHRKSIWTNWSKSKYATPTYYEDELVKIKKHKIPIYSFYVENSAKESFTKISEQTGGNCQYLNVKDEQKGQQQLTDFFVTQILSQVGQQQGTSGLGDKLVNDYKREYGYVK